MVLLTPLAWGSSLPGVLDDAGSGTDAGSTPAQALPLAYGSYHANLTPGDTDWFGFPSVSAPACLRASALSFHAMRFDVGSGAATVPGSLDENGTFSMLLAIQPGDVRLGAFPDVAPWDVFATGPYSFSAAATVPTLQGDAPGHRDAGDTLPTATALPGDCFRGTFNNDGDDVDYYKFQTSAPATLTYSLADDSPYLATLSVVDAAGSLQGVAIPAGDAGQVSLPTAGQYFLVAKAQNVTTDASYAIAIHLGPPDPGSGCRPMCFDL